MSVEVVCDGCGKRGKPGALYGVALSRGWGQISVEGPWCPNQAAVAPLTSLPYLFCSAECAHTVLQKVGEEIDNAYKSFAARAAKDSAKAAGK